MLTTHYMEEADALCDRLAIVDGGRVLVEDTPEALKNSVEAKTLYELDLSAPAESLLAKLRALPNVAAV